MNPIHTAIPATPITLTLRDTLRNILILHDAEPIGCLRKYVDGFVAEIGRQWPFNVIQQDDITPFDEAIEFAANELRKLLGSPVAIDTEEIEYS